MTTTPDSPTADTTAPIGDYTQPLGAMRAYCLGCCNGSAAEVRLCPATACPLHPFRMGRRPGFQRRLSEAQKQAARDRLPSPAGTPARTAVATPTGPAEGPCSPETQTA